MLKRNEDGKLICSILLINIVQLGIVTWSSATSGFYTFQTSSMETASQPSITEEQLRTLSIKQLNELLKQFPKKVEAELKSRRRILKNRGYATNTREKIGNIRSGLEGQKSSLQRAMEDQKRRVAQKDRQLTVLRQKRWLLEEHVENKRPMAKSTSWAIYYNYVRHLLRTLEHSCCLYTFFFDCFFCCFIRAPKGLNRWQMFPFTSGGPMWEPWGLQLGRKDSVGTTETIPISGTGT